MPENTQLPESAVDVGSTRLLAAADPFIKVQHMLDSLPPANRIPDDRPLSKCLPGIWPTMGDLRKLIIAIEANVPAQRPPAKGV
jgi:hypothetical protein